MIEILFILIRNCKPELDLDLIVDAGTVVGEAGQNKSFPF